MTAAAPRGTLWQRIALAALACLTGVLCAPASVSAHEAGEAGLAQTLYRQGILPSGRPLVGHRGGGLKVVGAAAACASCHRRSGLGTFEGRMVVPPITGRYLFHPGSRSRDKPYPTDDGPAEPGLPERGPYTDATLARAIRSGIGADGRTLDFLMPRYPLDDATMADLVGYLRHLSVGPVPGSDNQTLQFATIVTPDADSVERDAMLEVMRHFFTAKNSFWLGPAPPVQTHRRIDFRVVRRWNLHVWELSGAPDSWEQQLHEKLRAEPVFAVISGIGRSTWEPVHRFCESEAIPCLLPNVDLPVVSESDFYPVYFSRGVLLEADLIAQELGGLEKTDAQRRLVQVFRDGDIGAAAAGRLAGSIQHTAFASVERAVKAEAPAAAVTDALKDLRADDVVVLWLRGADVEALPRRPDDLQHAFVSGVMGGLEKMQLPESWRRVASITYPYDLPRNRAVRMNYPLVWFGTQHIPLTAERVQTDTYVACGIVAEAITQMLDNFERDYLVELIEEGLAPRLVNGYYNRLGLAPGQRFASKGGYLVRLADPGPQIVAESDWIVP